MLAFLLLTLVINGWNNQEEIDFIANDFLSHPIMDGFWYVCCGISALCIFGLFITSFLYVVLQMRQSMVINSYISLNYFYCDTIF